MRARGPCEVLSLRTFVILSVVALLAVAMVPGAQAAQVKWDLTGTLHSLNNGMYLMDASAPPPVRVAIPLTATGVVFVSNAPSTETTMTIQGQWVFTLRFDDVTTVPLANASIAQLELGVVRAGQFIPADAAPRLVAVTPRVGITTVVLNTLYTVEANQGDYLGLRLSMNPTQGGASIVAGTNTQGVNPSSVQTPDATPNFPVPELGSILLLTAGLVVVAGVVYSKRRQKA